MTEDVGTTPRRKLSTRERLAVWEKCKGICQGPCGRKLTPSDQWQADHPRALGLGGDDNPDLLVVLCEWCFPTKNANDASRIADAKRQKARNIGIKRQPTGRPFPCGRQSPWKKKISGEVVRR